MAEKIKPAGGISPQGSALSDYCGQGYKAPSAGAASVQSPATGNTGHQKDTVRMRTTGREAEEIELRGFFNILEESNLKIRETIAGEDGSTDGCVIPRLLGLTIGGAAARLVSAGLKVSKVTKQASDQPAGHVISQIPGAGERAEKGSGVHIVISA